MNYKQQAFELVAEHLLPFCSDIDVIIAKERAIKDLKEEHTTADIFRQNEIVNVIEEIEKINGLLYCN